jgi:hypothetical protein
MRSHGNKRQASVDAKPVQPVSAAPVPHQGLSAGEWLGLVAIAGLTIFFLATSWRKWPDPLIDFGRELYVPWRLAQGAVLYRDVEDIFGPLSQYFNAGLFALFGPGLMVLVAANLAVFAAILTSLYFLFRRAWGPVAALASSSIFVSIFAFGQYVGVGNYNYATPYSHEATHGVLVCLLLVLVLARWVEAPTLVRSSLAGVLFGLTAVLKAEILLAGGMVTIAALAVRWRSRKPIPLAAMAAGAASFALPTLAFAAYFATHVPWPEAFSMACQAWLNVTTTTGYTDTPIQRTFLGTDHLWPNVMGHVAATVVAILLIAGIGGIAWLADRNPNFWRRVLLAGLLVGGVTWLSCFEIEWPNVGRCFLGLAAIYVLVCSASILRNPKPGGLDAKLTVRWFLAVLAAVLMARMFLNGRFYHYGFYQAALAGVLIPAVLIGELPAWLALGRYGKNMILAGSLFLLAPGVITLASQSQEMFSAKTYAIGEGIDQFYSFPSKVDPVGEIVRALQAQRSRGSAGQTLLMLPEGVMVNYLVRMPSPVSAILVYGARSWEEEMLKDLAKHPPDWVAIVSRDLREYGIQRYGERLGRGQELLRWVYANYQAEMSVGGDPLDFSQSGAILLRRKDAPATKSIP